VPGGHDALDAHVLALSDRLDELAAEAGWKRGKQVLSLSFAFLAGTNVNGLRSIPRLDRRAFKEGFAESQRDEVIFPASSTREQWHDSPP
jgi:hypothetical protein